MLAHKDPATAQSMTDPSFADLLSAVPTTRTPPTSAPSTTTATTTSSTTTLTTEALESELVGLAGHLTAAHCRWLQLLAEFDDRDGWDGPGLRTCAHWLSWRVGMNLRTAFEQLRVAHALSALPETTSAFAAGRISYSKVRAITRVATPGTEQALVDLALAGTAGHVERVVRATRQARADPVEVHAERCVHWTWRDDGMLDLRGRFTPEQGALLLSALAATTDGASEKRAHCSAEHHEPRGGPAERAVDPGSHSDDAAGEAPVEPLTARRADALIALVTRTAVGSSNAAAGTAQVVLHIDSETATAHIERGPVVPLASAERIACAARVRALVKDRRGNPLYLGRTHRLATKTLIAAVSVRDQHRCRWAGCTETRHLDAHHIKHWLRGGRTDIDNLVLLCDRHHRLIHDHGYSMHGTGNDVSCHRPDGRLVADAGPPTEGRPEAVYEVSTAHGVTITDETLTPTWAGERLDPTPIMALLLPEPSRTRAA